MKKHVSLLFFMLSFPVLAQNQNAGATNIITVCASGCTATSPYTYVPSPGLVSADVCLIGGGGGSGGGARVASGTSASGGAGGGGAGGNAASFTAAQLGASVTVTVGVGGTAGAAAAGNDSPGGAGGQGTATTFGTLMNSAFPGGGGAGGQINAVSGGGAAPAAAGSGLARPPSLRMRQKCTATKRVSTSGSTTTCST